MYCDTQWISVCHMCHAYFASITVVVMCALDRTIHHGICKAFAVCRKLSETNVILACSALEQSSSLYETRCCQFCTIGIVWPNIGAWMHSTMMLHMKDCQWPVLTAADIAKLVGLVKSEPVDVLHNYCTTPQHLARVWGHKTLLSSVDNLQHARHCRSLHAM